MSCLGQVPPEPKNHNSNSSHLATALSVNMPNSDEPKQEQQGTIMPPAYGQNKPEPKEVFPPGSLLFQNGLYLPEQKGEGTRVGGAGG